MVHLSQEELAALLAEAATQVEVGARYVHFKDHTKEYVVKSLVILEATEEAAVVYEAQYDEHISFVRPLTSWMAEVDWPVGVGSTVPRFSKVGQERLFALEAFKR